MHGCCVWGQPCEQVTSRAQFNRFSLCVLADLVSSMGKTEPSNDASLSHQIFPPVSPRNMEPSMPILLCPWWILECRTYGFSKAIHPMGSEMSVQQQNWIPGCAFDLILVRVEFGLTGFLLNYKVSESWSHHLRAQKPLGQTEVVAIAANGSSH